MKEGTMENNTRQVDIMFCTPGHSLMSGYVKSLLSTFDLLREKGISFGFSNEYSSHVADAREITLNGDNHNIIEDTRPFKGQVSYKKLMWIDSDIVWNPQDILKLYESDKDIISGAYLLGSGEVVAYKELFGRAYTYDEVVNATELMRVHSVGFGFVCIKSGIFEKMTRPWFQSVNGTTTQDGKEFTFPILGEDLSFCKRANDLGFEVWLDPTIKVIHNKTMKLTWEGILP
jgi:hypothetical protein